MFNASPDIRQQIAATPELQPRAEGPLRGTPIRAVVLTNADVDHIAGLLSLREREPFAIYATRRVLQVLEANSIFNVLDPSIVQRRELVLGQRTDILDVKHQPTGIVIETFPVPRQGGALPGRPDESSRWLRYGGGRYDRAAHFFADR